MQTNNAMLFTFGLIFLLLAFFTPLIQAEFGQAQTDNSIDALEDSVSSGTVTDTNWITAFVSIFFWVVGAPAWLNIFILMIRLIFYVIVYDKIRGI